MKRELRLAACLALAAWALGAGAQPASEPLPSALSGRWTYVPPGGRTLIDSWSIRFEGPGAPGTVKGRLDWRGVNCGAKDEPVTATWDGAELRFESVLKPNANTQNANGNCGSGRTVWTLKRKPGTAAFDGEAAMNDRAVVVTVTAAP